MCRLPLKWLKWLTAEDVDKLHQTTEQGKKLRLEAGLVNIPVGTEGERMVKCSLCRFDIPPEAGVDGKTVEQEYDGKKRVFCCVGCAVAFEWEAKGANGDFELLENELDYPVSSLKERHATHIPDDAELLERVGGDLSALAALAFSLGATDAKVLRASDVVVDERAKFKCSTPKCRWYGGSLMCPPFTPSPAEIRALVDKYKYALLMRISGKPQHFTREGWLQRKHHKYFLRIVNLVGRVEAEAQAMGYYLAVGFSCGHCRLCAEEINPQMRCPAVKDGAPLWHLCKYPLRARPAMESVGIDVFATAKKAGWQSSYIGLSTATCEVEWAGTFGIVLVC